MIKVLALASALSLATGALPPKSSSQLLSEATTVFGGTVHELESRIVDDHGNPERSDERSDHTKHQIVQASILVSDVTKSNDNLQLGSEVKVVYRHILLPKSFVGPQGQTVGMTTGDSVTIYAIDNDRQGPFEESSAHLQLLEPNGWELNHNQNNNGESSTPESETGTRSPPKLKHSRRHGFQLNTPLSLTRDVKKAECDWLDSDMLQGSTVYLFHGHTYGVIGPTGVAVTKENGQGPFFELPVDALSQGR